MFILIGVGAGVLAGLFGVGGGLVIVPILVLLMGFSQIAASGTSLVALLAPVGAGGVYAFYKAGKISGDNVKQGLLISLGMFLGSFFGAKIALAFPDFWLKRGFCVFLVVVAVRMWISTLGVA
jgi:uncharacterized membrane protein YfcA